MKKNLYTFISTLLWIRPIFMSICGPDAVPHRFSYHHDGQPMIECSTPTCFTINAKNQTSDFYRAMSDTGIDQTESVENFGLFIIECYHISQGDSCREGSEFLQKEAAYTPKVSTICCENQHTKTMHEHNVVVSIGQEIVGGKILFRGQQVAFDYISKVVKMVEGDEASYKVTTRRIYCPINGLAKEKEIDLFKTETTSILPFEDNNYVNYPKSYTSTYNLSNHVPTYYDRKTAPSKYAAPMPQASEHNIQQSSSFVQESDREASLANRSCRGPRQAGSPTYVNLCPGESVAIQQAYQQASSYQSYNYYPVQAARGAAAAMMKMFCFSGDTEVITDKGQAKKMSELSLGDWVMAVDKENKVVYSRVISWIHKIPYQEAEFLKIKLEDGTSVKMTPGHLIFKAKCSGTSLKIKSKNLPKDAVACEQVQVGDCLYTSVKNTHDFIQNRVISIEMVHEIGIYAPLTDAGKIITNNIYASCYSVKEHTILQNNFSIVIKMFNAISRRIFGSSTKELMEAENLPLSSRMIIDMMKVILPSMTF